MSWRFDDFLLTRINNIGYTVVRFPQEIPPLMILRKTARGHVELFDDSLCRQSRHREFSFGSFEGVESTIQNVRCMAKVLALAGLQAGTSDQRLASLKLWKVKRWAISIPSVDEIVGDEGRGILDRIREDVTSEYWVVTDTLVTTKYEILEKHVRPTSLSAGTDVGDGALVDVSAKSAVADYVLQSYDNPDEPLCFAVRACRLVERGAGPNVGVKLSLGHELVARHLSNPADSNGHEIDRQLEFGAGCYRGQIIGSAREN